MLCIYIHSIQCSWQRMNEVNGVVIQTQWTKWMECVRVLGLCFAFGLCFVFVFRMKSMSDEYQYSSWSWYSLSINTPNGGNVHTKNHMILRSDVNSTWWTWIQFREVCLCREILIFNECLIRLMSDKRIFRCV